MSGKWFARALLLATCAMPTVAWGQQTGGGTQVEDIVVTAERRSESLQDVPISITAFSAQDLEDRSVATIADLATGTPNVHFNSSTQGAATFTIGIRGIKSPSIELVNEQPVATYVDGVYQATPLGSGLLLGPDLQRIEVLRGPQGTLFGRNTVGGAMTIFTQAPTDFFEGRIMGGIGSDGLQEARGMLNVPLGEQAALRLNFASTRTDGFLRDTTSGHQLGDTNLDFFRAQLRIEPTNDLEMILRGHYFHNESGGNMVQGIFIVPSPNPSFRAGAIYLGLITVADGAPAAGLFPQVQNAYYTCGNGPTPSFADRCFGAENPIGNEYEEWGTSFSASLQLSENLSLRSISAYTEYNQDARQDYDASPFRILWQNGRPYGHAFTQEFQLNGSAFDGRLDFASGVFYYRHWNNDQARNDSLNAIAGANSRSRLESYHLDTSLGFYGQATVSLTDALRVTAGLRYTEETKEAATTQFTSRPPPTNQACTLPVPNALCVAESSTSFDSLDYTAGVDFDLTDDMMVYFRTARGFLAGGINQRSTTGVPFLAYDPQISTNYEIGFKADFFDRRARMNLAIFHTDVEDLQKSVARTFLNTSGLPVSVVSQINAAQATIQGAELELTVVPFENFEIRASVGYVDPQYDEFFADGPGGPGTLDLSDTNFIQTPEWTIGISPSYTIPTSWGEIRGQIDYYWQSDEDLSPPVSSPLVVAGRSTIQEAYSLVNARLAFRFGEDTEVALWGKNLTDEHYFNSILDLSNSLGIMNARLGEPRTYGVQVSREF